MDRKSILVLIICFVLLMLWIPLTNRIYPPVPAPRFTNSPNATNLVVGGTNRAAAATSTMTAAQGQGTQALATSSAQGASLQMPAGATTFVTPSTPEELLTLGTAEARYAISSYGGGIRTVELLEYHESVGRDGRSLSGTNQFVVLNQRAPLPILTLLGAGYLSDPAPFTLSRLPDGGGRAEKVLTNGVRIVKEFRPATNHVVHAVVRIENTSTQPLLVPSHELIIGTSSPIHRQDKGQAQGVQWFDGSNAEFVAEGWFSNPTLGCLPGTPRDEYLTPPVRHVAWAASHYLFFTVIAAPKEPAPQLRSLRIPLPPPSKAEVESDPKAVLKPHGYQSGFLYTSGTLAAGQAISHEVELFCGPKEYNTLAKLGGGRDRAMNFTTFFGWFAKALLLSMNALHAIGLPYGLAIIGITIIIKGCFWPLTLASTRSMKRMQELQPQMKALQERYKDDPKKMNMKLMEFMKENKVNPMGSCLPMLLQIPVFIGFYQMLQSAIELRGASFLWAHDLSQPDTVAILFGIPINPFPLIMGATQFWQTRLTPPSPGMDPVQQKMFQYMPLMFIFILYNFAAGLALYWTVQNLISILQMKVTKTKTPPPSSAPPQKPGAGLVKKRA